MNWIFERCTTLTFWVICYIRSLTWLICRGEGDKKPYYRSYASDLKLWIFNDIVNTGYDLFRRIGMPTVNTFLSFQMLIFWSSLYRYFHWTGNIGSPSDLTYQLGEQVRDGIFIRLKWKIPLAELDIVKIPLV